MKHATRGTIKAVLEEGRAQKAFEAASFKKGGYRYSGSQSSCEDVGTGREDQGTC